MRFAAVLLALAVSTVAQAGSAFVTWEAPTTREDGSPLVLSGFRLYWGVSPGQYEHSVTIDNPDQRSYRVAELVDCERYYFAATALDLMSVESRLSNEDDALIGGDCSSPPNPPENLAVSSANLTAYGIVQSRDRVVLLPVGSVAAGTSCLPMQVLNRFVVPRESVTFAGSVRPEVVLAECESF